VFKTGYGTLIRVCLSIFNRAYLNFCTDDVIAADMTLTVHGGEVTIIVTLI